MNRTTRLIILLAAFAVLACGCRGPQGSGQVNLRLRARIDSLNKGAFMNRYEDPRLSIQYAHRAVALVHDSLPDYQDGIMRAFNNIAFGYYMLARHDSAAAYIDSVTAASALPQPLGKRVLHRNSEVERVLAELMQVRLLQRSCCIAESYQLLYDINQSEVLKRQPDNYLYSFAQMEYFITSLTLNYHYRNLALASSSGTTLSDDTQKAMAHLLSEVEQGRRKLKCDYAEEMSLNYALAHSYYRLAAASHSNPYLLGRAYDYLADNAKLLSIPGQYCIYHLANVFQLQAFIAADTNILRHTYTRHPLCHSKLVRLMELTSHLYATDTSLAEPRYGLNMFEVSTNLFFQTADPYQHLGAVVAAAEYCLHQNEYNRARNYYTMALEDPSWHDGMAPKFESMLYDGLIRMNYSPRPDDNTRWYAREMELLAFINSNEGADVKLQDRLFRSETRNRYYLWAMAAGAVFLAVMGVLLLMLRRRSKVLRKEKQALQEAKRQDVERIANVETCLSVLRHDISPFLSYLTNKTLSSAMRQEILDQLLRTFANIKNWTNLSIPSGLQFQASCVSLDEVMESVKASCPNLRGGQVALVFEPSGLRAGGDRQLIEILLRNLVNNALQHTPSGQVTVRASVSSTDSRFLHLEVHDTGCGMDAETLDTLFRADKKTLPAADPSAAHGTGFGLILCRYIIKRHDDNTLRGCRIWADSRPGQGTTMHCLLARHHQDQKPNTPPVVSCPPIKNTHTHTWTP